MILPNLGSLPLQGVLHFIRLKYFFFTQQQQVELVTIAIDANLVLQGSASNGQSGRKAVSEISFLPNTGLP